MSTQARKRLTLAASTPDDVEIIAKGVAALAISIHVVSDDASVTVAVFKDVAGFEYEDTAIGQAVGTLTGDGRALIELADIALDSVRVRLTPGAGGARVDVGYRTVCACNG